MKQFRFLNVNNRKEFREWLLEYHDKCKECWVSVIREIPSDNEHLFYIDLVEELLCFGWIDSTYKKHNGIYYQRITPRKKNSIWSELNKERCRRLEKLGLMTDAGRAILPNLNEKFCIDNYILDIIQNDELLKQQIQNMPKLYINIKLGNIQRNKNNPIVFNTMLNNFIEKTKQGKMYGPNWNDYGRLLNY